jgi:CBS domain-containing membrane protein
MSIQSASRPDSRPHSAPARAQRRAVRRTTHVHGASDIVHGLVQRLQMPWLLRHYPHRLVLALFSVLNGGIGLAIIAAVAHYTHSPLVFPALGPMAFLFFYRPTARSASPRNAIVSHTLGAVVGFIAVTLFGLRGIAPTPLTDISWTRVAAISLSFATTLTLMVLLHTEHPPALSTAIIVALGGVTQPPQLLLLLGGVVLLTCQAILVNRAAGLPYPLWAPHARTPRRSLRRMGRRARSQRRVPPARQAE